MPCFNTQRYIAQAVMSILDQDFADLEMLVIDDGSTDDSPRILRDLAREHDRLRVVCREQNLGLCATLNEGLGLARGAYLGRLDADDVALPGRIAAQVAALDADPQLVAVGGQADAIDERGDVIADYDVPTDHEAIEAMHLQGDSAIHHPAVMLRLDAVKRVGGYLAELVPCEDYDLWMKLGEVGRVANLPQKVVHKRMLTSGAVVTMSDKQHDRSTRALRAAWDRRGLPGEPPMPDSAPLSKADFYRQWGWMALRRRGRAGAWRYAVKALRAQPMAVASWKLAACAARGR